MKVPYEIVTTVAALQSRLNDVDVYYAGGCLQDRKIQDYDVVVIGCNLDYEDVMVEFDDLQYMDDCDVTTSYPDEIENPYFMIVVTKVAGVKVDFLFAKEDQYIEDILDSFPLSIQMQALNVGCDEHIIGAKYSLDPIVVYTNGKSEAKYRKYYPNTRFVTPEGNTILPIEEEPHPF